MPPSDNVFVERLALPLLAAAWLMVAVTVIRSRRRRRRAGTPRRWHAALATVGRWPAPRSAEVPAGVTWCRTLPPTARVPHQRSRSADPADLREPARR